MHLVEKATSVRGPGYLGRSRHTVSLVEDKVNSGPGRPSQIIVLENAYTIEVKLKVETVVVVSKFCTFMGVIPPWFLTHLSVQSMAF